MMSHLFFGSTPELRSPTFRSTLQRRFEAKRSRKLSHCEDKSQVPESISRRDYALSLGIRHAWSISYEKTNYAWSDILSLLMSTVGRSQALQQPPAVALTTGTI